jgi:hypothetical protein
MPPTARPATGSDGAVPARTVELFVRALSPAGDGGCAEAAVERLERLDGGPLTGYTVHVWGEAVGLDAPLAGTDHARFVLDRVGEFRDWTARTGADLIGFETRETDCRLTDRCYRLLSLPTVALAEYRDGDLVGVAPRRTDDGQVTVADHLDDLAADRSEPLVAD